MSRKYKFHNKEGLYFVSFAAVYWIDIFVREVYFEEIAKGLDYCRKNKGMEIYAWCIMPSHIHLIFRAKENNPSDVLRDFKKYTSKRMQLLLSEYGEESRKEWILWMMQRAGSKNGNVKDKQFWQQHNQPIELWSPDVIEQKLNYIHQNPVKAGFICEAEHWKYSSAVDYSGGKGMLEIDFLY